MLRCCSNYQQNREKHEQKISLSANLFNMINVALSQRKNTFTNPEAKLLDIWGCLMHIY